MNIQKIRKDTRGLSDGKLFFNSAGSSLMPNIVVDKMVDYLKQEEMSGGYEVANRNEKLLEEFYTETAKLINGKPSNIGFMTSATEAFAKAISSIVFQENDVVITTIDDYISNQITFISLQKRLKIKVIRIRKLENNALDLDDLEKLIQKHQPKLVAVTHIPTNSGLIQDIVGVGKICRKYNILYLADCCQSVGQMPVDVAEIGCDFLTATGRKFLRGPRGSGFLYVSDRALEQDYAPILLDHRGAHWSADDDYELFRTAKRFEHFETSYAAIVGMAEAVKYANNIGLHNIEKHNKTLVETLRNNLENGGFKVLDWGENLSSIVTFCGADNDLENIQKVLRENNVFFSVSYKNSALIDFTDKKVDGAVRLSPHYFNTLEEVEKVSEILITSLN